MQRTIRRDIVDLVVGALEDSPETVAVGLFDDQQLIGVAAYSATTHFEILCLATEITRHGEGIGTALKRLLLEIAEELSYAEVFSLVHRANRPMLSINEELDAWIEPDLDDGDFMLCIVDISTQSKVEGSRAVR